MSTGVEQRGCCRSRYPDAIRRRRQNHPPTAEIVRNENAKRKTEQAVLEDQYRTGKVG
jgi:hypothetical protein